MQVSARITHWPILQKADAAETQAQRGFRSSSIWTDGGLSESGLEALSERADELGVCALSRTEAVTAASTRPLVSEPSTASLGRLGLAAFATDRLGVVCGWNAVATSLYGTSLEGAPISRVRPAAQDAAKVSSALEQLASRGFWKGEVTLETAGGLPLRLSVRAVSVLDQSGRLLGYEGVASEAEPSVAPERRRELEAATELSLMRQMPDVGSWSWDPANDRLVVSERFTSLLGAEMGTPLTIAHALSAMPPEDAERVRSALSAMILQGAEPSSIRYRVRAADGSVRHLEAHCTALRAEDGTLIKILGLTRDVTRQVQGAEQLRRPSPDAC